jgi:cob(I)alamin adenosyltransferase
MPGGKGFVHLYTGDGKGKTTAAMGLALRAAGQGLRVEIIQFMKGRRYGEVKALEQVKGITVRQYGRDEFVDRRNPAPVDVQHANAGFEKAKELLECPGCDVIVLDEINVALDYGLIDLDDLLDALKARRADLEVVLTGRYAPRPLFDAADLVTEMREMKHYYRQGQEGRAGVEF